MRFIDEEQTTKTGRRNDEWPSLHSFISVASCPFSKTKASFDAPSALESYFSFITRLFNMHHVTGIRLLVLPMAVSAAVHQISVGQGGLKFSPDSITAKVGDQVQFNFDSSLGHSVVEGDYNNPCQPLDASAFYSGTVSSGVSLATFLHSCICSPSS